jgi:hypothetical protein
MGDDGQMILLSALIACLCLMGVVACVAAVDDSSYNDGRFLSSDSIDNVRWAQDNALQWSAFYYSIYSWDSRAEAAARFKAEANSSMDSLSGVLLKHGLAYLFTYNDSLGGEYAALHPGNGTENIGGVLVEPSRGNVKIRGCAYDVIVDDGVTAYRMSQVKIFE